MIGRWLLFIFISCEPQVTNNFAVIFLTYRLCSRFQPRFLVPGNVIPDKLWNEKLIPDFCSWFMAPTSSKCDTYLMQEYKLFLDRCYT